jgi:tRNA G10  N-methylase Trm11
VFQNKVFKNLKRITLNGKLKAIRNVGHAVYRSHSVVRIMKCERRKWAGHISRMRETRDAYRNVMGKPLVNCLRCRNE